jgi:hypothetical protein
MKKHTDEELKNIVANIRTDGILPILENAINYGDPWRALYIAAIEEITELRKQVSL